MHSWSQANTTASMAAAKGGKAQEESSASINIAAIVGGTAAGVAVASAAALLVMRGRRKKRRLGGAAAADIEAGFKRHEAGSGSSQAPSVDGSTGDGAASSVQRSEGARGLAELWATAAQAAAGAGDSQDGGAPAGRGLQLIRFGDSASGTQR